MECEPYGRKTVHGKVHSVQSTPFRGVDRWTPRKNVGHRGDGVNPPTESHARALQRVAFRLSCILVCDSESIGREQIAVETGMSKPTVYRHIDTFLKRRLIKRNGNVYEVSFDD